MMEHTNTRRNSLYGGRYEIEKKLGQGGMGEVFLARDIKMDRWVALKVMAKIEHLEDQGIQRFFREVRLCSNLAHPNIVPVYDFGELEGKHYYTMAFIDGCNLKKYVEEKGKLPTGEALSIMLEITRTVAYAHEQGVLHRDIKPENIMIDHDGKIYLMDFGLARQVASEDVSLTQQGTILGSPLYMSPEQAKGKKKIGFGTDIYSLGGVLYFMLAGRPAFIKKETFALLLEVTSKRPPSLRNFNPQVSPEIEWIAMKCLEKLPHKRYPSTKKLARDLENLIAGKKTTFYSRSALKRNVLYTPFAITLLLFLSLMTLALLFSGQWRNAKQNRSKAIDAQMLSRWIAKIDGEDGRKYYEEGLKFFDEYIAQFPNAASAYYGRGLVHYLQGNVRQARADIGKCVELDPKHASSYIVLGKIHYDGLDYPKAIKYYDRGLALEPGEHNGFNNRGSLHYKQGDFALALSDFRSALAIKEKAVYHANIGMALQELKKNTEALEHYDKAIRLEPEYTDAYQYRGFLFASLNRYEEAERDLCELIRIEPGNADHYALLARFYFARGNYDRCLENSNKAVHLKKQDAHFRLERAQFRAFLGYTAGALEDFDSAVASSPNLAKCYYLRGQFYWKIGESAKAKKDFRTFLELSPEHNLRTEVESLLKK